MAQTQYVHSVVGHKCGSHFGVMIMSLEYTEPSMQVHAYKVERIMLASTIYTKYCLPHTHTIWVESKVGRELLLKYILRLLPSGESCFVLQSGQAHSLVANFPQCLLLAVWCVCRAGGSDPADSVLAGPLFHSSKKNNKKNHLWLGTTQCHYTDS